MGKGLNKSVSGSFNDQAYLDAYQQTGEFPKIHKDFGLVVKTFAGENEGCMDIGTCIGIMSIYNVHNGRSNCIGIEGNAYDFNRCLPHPNVAYENIFVQRDTFDRIRELIKEHKVTLVTARRVIPEIEISNGIQVVKDFSKLLAEAGVKKIVLQGRLKVKNPSARLWNIDLEAECFYGEYKKTKAWKDIYLLELK